MERPDRNPKAEAVARWSVVVVFAWLGAMRMLEGGDAFAAALANHVLLPDAAGDLGPVLAVVVGMLQVGIAVTLAFAWGAQRVVAVASLLGFVLAAIPLTLLFTNPVWIPELGGFPAIGSGQGLIKYLAIMGLARFVHANVTGDETGVRHAKVMLVLGLVVPLVWIGGMKFTEIEAQGIEPLLASSPFFAWMLNVVLFTDGVRGDWSSRTHHGGVARGVVGRSPRLSCRGRAGHGHISRDVELPGHAARLACRLWIPVAEWRAASSSSRTSRCWRLGWCCFSNVKYKRG